MKKVVFCLTSIILFSGMIHCMETDCPAAGENNWPTTPLTMAIKRGDCHRANILLMQGSEIKGSDIEMAFEGSEMHHILTECLQVDSAKRNKEKLDELTIKMARGNNIPALQRALIAGGDPNSRTNNKNTPLHIAASLNLHDIAVALSTFKADVSAKNHKGMTPLHYACWKGHYDVASLLLNMGASDSEPAGDGRTPVQVAKEYGHKKLIFLFKLRKKQTLEDFSMAEMQKFIANAIKGKVALR